MKLITKVYKVMTLEVKTQFGENFKGIVSFFPRPVRGPNFLFSFHFALFVACLQLTTTKRKKGFFILFNLIFFYYEMTTFVTYYNRTR